MPEEKPSRRKSPAGTGPMHARVRQAIADQITAGQYKPGDLIPSEHELCEKFGVSRIVIRQALGALTNEGLVERFPGRGTFVRQRATGAQGNGRSVISLVLANAIGSFMAQVVRGVDSAVRAAGMDLHLAISYDRADEEARLIRELVDKRAAGALVFTCDTPGPANPNCLDFLRVREAGIPILFVDRYLSQLPIGYVVTADEAGMRQLAEHFIALGHTKIGYMDHAVEVTSVTARRAGFFGALRSHRLHAECVLHVDRSREGDKDDAALAYTAMREYLATGKPLPTAMVGCNSYYTIGMFRALKEAGVSVPEDVALAGFDDLPEAAVLEVPLTVLRAPVEEMGRIAAQNLIKLIESGATGEDVHVMLPGELVVRESCGAKAHAAGASA